VIVLVEQIHEGGLTVDEPFGVDKLSEALALGANEARLKASRGGTLKVHLQKVSGGVLVEAGLSTQVVGPCKRCLAEVQVEVPVSFTLHMVPSAKLRAGDDEDEAGDGHGPSAGSFDLTDADEEPFDGKTIDLDPIVREQVLLALPLYVVCKDDCKGLCSVCGQNLNERECGCERKMVDPRLAALKDIKLN
jgi:uncharacterized protein